MSGDVHQVFEQTVTELRQYRTAVQRAYATGELGRTIRAGFARAGDAIGTFPDTVLVSSFCSAVLFRGCIGALGVTAKLLRISSSNHVLGTLFGVTGVAAASVPTAITFIWSSRIHDFLCGRPASLLAAWPEPIARRAKANMHTPHTHWRHWWEDVRFLCTHYPRARPFLFTSRESYFYVGATLLIFRLLGGRYRRVCPSDLFHPGAFSRVSLPATNGSDYAADAVRNKLQVMGFLHGCHHCGSRRAVPYIGDHMPPNKYAKGRKQRFYPQCAACSQQQASAVSLDRRTLVLHKTLGRAYHLWFPLPLLLMALKPAWDAIDDERKRANKPSMGPAGRS